MAEQNHMQVIFDAKSVNESLARMVVTAFMFQALRICRCCSSDYQ